MTVGGSVYLPHGGAKGLLDGLVCDASPTHWDVIVVPVCFPAYLGLLECCMCILFIALGRTSCRPSGANFMGARYALWRAQQSIVLARPVAATSLERPASRGRTLSSWRLHVSSSFNSSRGSYSFPFSFTPRSFAAYRPCQYKRRPVRRHGMERMEWMDKSASPTLLRHVSRYRT